MVSCISSSASANGVFIASDDEVLSTSDLCYLCGHFAGKRPRLISMPATATNVYCTCTW